MIYIEDMNLALQFSHILIITLCIIAASIYFPNTHYFGGIIRWWSYALLLVLVMNSFRIAGLENVIGELATHTIDALMSSLSNLAIFVLVLRIKENVKGGKPLSLNTKLLWALFVFMPVLILAICSSFEVDDKATVTSMHIYVDVFSFLAFIRLAKWMGRYLIAVGRIVSVTLYSYGVLQLMHTLPSAYLVRLGSQSCQAYSVIYSCLAMGFKIGSTLLILVAISEFSRRKQIQMLGAAELLKGMKVPMDVRGFTNRVALFWAGGDEEHKRTAVETINKMGYEVDVITTDNNDELITMLSRSLTCKYGLVIYDRAPTDNFAVAISNFMAQRKYCLFFRSEDSLDLSDAPLRLQTYVGIYRNKEELKDDIQVRVKMHWGSVLNGIYLQFKSKKQK